MTTKQPDLAAILTTQLEAQQAPTEAAYRRAIRRRNRMIRALDLRGRLQAKLAAGILMQSIAGLKG
jgi:hypothetical protein